jgi:hypothetical protein
MTFVPAIVVVAMAFMATIVAGVLLTTLEVMTAMMFVLAPLILVPVRVSAARWFFITLRGTRTNASSGSTAQACAHNCARSSADRLTDCGTCDTADGTTEQNVRVVRMGEIDRTHEGYSSYQGVDL